ncbi:unnamed protein product [Brassicogethes aeneus]|uniref:CHK kinase-like domain-containing protein n=1 Tax=Brassicogethes aeneus TaxID=1431903 RepID=A0A9P0AX45_BRAAE|nr:unnamed protein product [Brassicogethes aeneus]
MSAVNNINSIVEKIAKNIPLAEYDVEYGEGNEKGEGYMGEMAFVKITPKGSGKTYNVAIKRAFTNQSIREEVPIRDVFLNEVFFYKECFPVLQQLQSELDLPKFNNAPKCFYTSTEPENEYLAMENLKTSGFELFPKEKIIPYDHFEVLFKIYANLHATSVVLRKTQPEKFEKLASNFKEVATQFFDNPGNNNLWNAFFKQTGNKLIPGQDDKTINAFEKKYSNNGVFHFMDSWGYHGQDPVINHGDCWSNNVMLKYNKQKELVDLKVLDWQLLKLGSPVHDLSYCLYSGGSKDTFDRLDELLQVYYMSFSDVLKIAGLNFEEVYPYSLLEKEWKEYGKYGWLMSLIVIKVKLTNPEDKVDLMDLCNSDDREIIAKKKLEGTPSEAYDRRIRELLLHVHEIGAL